MADLATELSEHKKILDAQGKAFHDMKQVVEKFGADSVEGKAALQKIDSKFEEFEKKNQEMITGFKAIEGAEKELKERIVDLEGKLARPGAGGVDQRKGEYDNEMKSLIAYAKYGTTGDSLRAHAEELKYLRTDVNADGGYLVAPEYVNEILKNITEISPIRSISKVRSTSRKTVLIPTRDTLVSVGWNGEGVAASESNSQYGMQEITMGKLSVQTRLTREEVMDSSFNMEQQVRDDVAEAFAQAEGAAFVSGTGINRPQGFLVAASVDNSNTAVVGALGADDLITLTGTLKTGYMPYFVLNRRTLAYIRRLKDGNGQYLWAPGIAAGQPNSIIGEPYISAIDMPDVATGQTPVAYGDFMRGYMIVDRTMMTMIRDEVTLAAQDMIALTFHRRLAGQVVRGEAIKKLTVA